MVVPKMRETSERHAKHRKIDAIWRENEQKKAELHGTITPSMFRNPKFYFALMFILTLLGYGLFSATDKAVERKNVSPEMRALRNLNVLAEGLGRYHFHLGRYPSTRQGGLGALVRVPGPVADPKWNGPYVNLLCKDPWGTPYVYEMPKKSGELPVLFSCGPDRLPNTADDLKPDPAKFDPGTEWTNGWVSASQRMPGVIILENEKKTE
jgi:general secretion pathway protein G